MLTLDVPTQKAVARLASPIGLFLLMLLVIFGGEMLIMFVLLPLLSGGKTGIAADILDACLLTLMASPLLWFLIVQPLRDAVMVIEDKSRQLIAAQDELLRQEKLSILGQLAGSVGHELRNPLGVMNNAIFYLNMIQPDAEKTVKEYLGIIKNEIDNSQRIITDLLDFARTKPPQAKMTTVAELIRESLDRCAMAENVEVLIDIPDSLPAVRVDSHQLRQVFQNLMVNAVQAMPGGGVLDLSARLVGGRQGGAEDAVAIRVGDTGDGIAPENMQRLFQPLFTTKAKGIGLGLVVCKNLVEANGGRIDVESTPGQGTSFVVMLPVEKR